MIDIDDNYLRAIVAQMKFLEDDVVSNRFVSEEEALKLVKEYLNRWQLELDPDSPF